MSIVSNLNLFLRRPQVPRMLANFTWLVGDKIFRLGMGVVVGVAVARHLGPTRFGELNYALALVGLIAVFANLGLDSITQRDLVRQPGERGKILGTCFGVKLVCSLICYGLLFTISTINSVAGAATVTSLIVGLTLLGAAASTFDLWFQAQLLAKYTVYSQNTAFLIASAVRLTLVWKHAGLSAFAWVLVLETATSSLLYAAFYQGKGNTIANWSFDTTRAKLWLFECWPLVLASLAITIYMRIDQIMLAKMLNDHAVGVYSVAVRISEIGYFIPMMLASTLLPSVARSREAGEAVYQQRRQHYFDLSSVLALAIIIPCSLLSGRLIHWLYGPSYQEAAGILLVHIWSAIFVFIGVARGQYLLLEGHLKFSFYATLVGAIINVVLNLVLIPLYGGLGAAWATLVAYAASAFFSSFLSREIFPMGIQQQKSFNLPMALFRLAHAR